MEATMRLILATLIALLLLAAPASAATLHVSTTGSDNPGCTALAPCRTFQAANTAWQPGDEILVGPGTHAFQPIDSPQRSSGSAVFRPASPGTVTVDGIKVNSADHLRFEGFKITANSDIVDGTAGQSFGVQFVGNEIVGSTIWFDHTNDTLIEGNQMHDGPPTSSSRKIGVRSISDTRPVIRGNTITRYVEDPVQVTNPTDGVIDGNELSFAYPQGGEHTDCIHVLGADGLRIVNNVIHHVQHCLMFTDFLPEDVTIENNTVTDVEATSMKAYGTGSPNLRVVNNTFQRSGTIGADFRTSHPGGVAVNNVFDKVSSLDQPTESNNVVSGDAGMFDPGTLIPAEGGVLHDTGSAAFAPASDGLGSPRVGAPDIGARERQGGEPDPGDTPADAVWTAPTGATVGTPIPLDGSASTGDLPLSCNWTFENEQGTMVFSTAAGCQTEKTFTMAGTKYVRLTVTDADGDTDSNFQSFEVAAAPTPTATPTPEPTPTPTPTPDPSCDDIQADLDVALDKLARIAEIINE